jgi:hypothetical protein
MMTARGLCLSFGLVIAACGHNSGGNNNGNADAPGGGGSDSGSAGCGLVTCMSQGATCGPVGDGCGGVIDCGSCTAPDTCGGGGTLFTCGGGGSGPMCMPKTCADVGANCGQVADGCGGLTATCGTCGTNETCGGMMPNQCSPNPACTGPLCNQVMACTNMPKTTITGTVTAPGHTNTALFGQPDPIYAALVYIPNGMAGPPTYGVMPFTPGVSCDSCSSLVTGTPLEGALTGVDGTFTITDAPCGTNIPLVIQLGRWRRMITIPTVACCASTTLTNVQTHLPRNKVGETGDVYSDIPQMAISTGSVDTLHCVLRKIGIEDSEFTNPTGTGRVHMFKDNGAQLNAQTPAASTLYGNATTLDDYDMTLFECVGNRVPKSAADQQRVINYANAGGRVFATHFSYVWLTNSDGTNNSNTAPKPFYQTAAWDVNQGNFASTTGLVDTSVQGDPATQARRTAFAQWLQLVGASTTLGQIIVNVTRHDFNSVNPMPGTASSTPAQLWLKTTDAFTGPLHYTFDTPIAYTPDPKPTTQCGRVLFSDFHVSDASSGGSTFPAECTDGPMTPQEKTLEFMLFDLASCVGPPPGSCAPRSCAQQGLNCGQAGTGCDDGIVLDCGSCPNGMSCNGGTCSDMTCTPRTCADAGAMCGIIGDGCGGTVDCGPCPDGQSCGGGGPNLCGSIIL